MDGTQAQTLIRVLCADPNGTRYVNADFNAVLIAAQSEVIDRVPDDLLWTLTEVESVTVSGGSAALPSTKKIRRLITATLDAKVLRLVPEHLLQAAEDGTGNLFFRGTANEPIGFFTNEALTLEPTGTTVIYRFIREPATIALTTTFSDTPEILHSPICYLGAASLSAAEGNVTRYQLYRLMGLEGIEAAKLYGKGRMGIHYADYLTRT